MFFSYDIDCCTNFLFGLYDEIINESRLFPHFLPVSSCAVFQSGHGIKELPIPVKIANYPLLYFRMNSCNFKGMYLHKEWDCRFGKSLILAWLSLTLVSYVPYYVNFRLNNWPDMTSVLPCFLNKFGWYFYKFFAEVFCVLLRRVESWTEIKELIKRQFLTVLYSVTNKSHASQFWQLGHSEQVIFYQTNFI